MKHVMGDLRAHSYLKIILLFGLALPLQLLASEAYQLLRGDPAGYAAVVPGKALKFPEDHLPHPDYRIEWWYLTANLIDASGAHYDVHWTLFRQSMSPLADPGGWSSNQVWMAHAALSTPEGHVYKQQFARGGIGQAGVEWTTTNKVTANPESTTATNSPDQFQAWLDNGMLKGQGSSPLPGQLSFTVEDFEVSLNLNVATPWVLQGDAGYSRKSNMGQASYYYSQPHITITGEVTRNQQTTNLTGQGWLDREWSSQPLAPNQPGWDWLSVHLDDGHALMVYRLRQDNGEDWISGSWITPEGQTTSLNKSDIVFEPIRHTTLKTGTNTHHKLPLHWRVALPGLGLSWTVAPRSEDHWLNTAFPYWEGPVTLEGTMAGQGFLELTGYPETQ